MSFTLKGFCALYVFLNGPIWQPGRFLQNRNKNNLSLRFVTCVTSPIESDHILRVVV